jgi:hypothetical protein
MIVHALSAAPVPALALALARFEEQFTYPLGPGRSFRIAHGDDYPRFFRAIGDGVCFVAERAGEVLGVLGLAATELSTPAGPVPAIYLGDLKIAPSARGGRVLVRLAEAAAGWCRGRAECGFGVVMDGTPVTPDRYTGRLGIPAFRSAAQVAVLRLPATPGSITTEPWQGDSARSERCYTALTARCYATNGGDPAERSIVPPVWLAAPDGSACGRLEDTRRAKRLILNDGGEMISAHLSCIGYADTAALVELLRVAGAAAAARGFPALFAAILAGEAPAVVAALGASGIVTAPATVFAAGLDRELPWSINSAEI